MNENTYWNHNGKHQKEYDQLWKYIPNSGKVTDPEHKFLELLRMASKLYYRYYNDGDVPGKGESAPGEVYRDYFNYCRENLRLYRWHLPDHMKNAYHPFSSFSWTWNEKNLESWVDAIVRYSIERGQHLLGPIAEKRPLRRSKRLLEKKKRKT